MLSHDQSVASAFMAAGETCLHAPHRQVDSAPRSCRGLREKNPLQIRPNIEKVQCPLLPSFDNTLENIRRHFGLVATLMVFSCSSVSFPLRYKRRVRYRNLAARTGRKTGRRLAYRSCRGSSWFIGPNGLRLPARIRK